MVTSHMPRALWLAVGLCSACGESGETGRLVGITEAHNEIRAAVSDPTPEPALGDLTWSDDLGDIAQDYAEELADQQCALVHSQGGKLGENLFAAFGFRASPRDVVQLWASEADCYTFGAFKQGDSCASECDPYGGCGHYTQVVWRDTTEVGCGVAECGGGEVWVCNYSPQGNFVGRTPY